MSALAAVDRWNSRAEINHAEQLLPYRCGGSCLPRALTAAHCVNFPPAVRPMLEPSPHARFAAKPWRQLTCSIIGRRPPVRRPSCCALQLLKTIGPEDARFSRGGSMLPLCCERRGVLDQVASDPDDALSWARP